MNYKPLGRPGETSSSANENGHHYNNYGASIEEISNREAVIKGYSFMDKNLKIPKI